MNAFKTISVAIAKGFVRDRTSVFFAVIFPLMFLVLFGGVLDLDENSRLDLVVVGEVALIEQMPPAAKAAFDDTFATTQTDDLGGALEQVRDGDASAAVEMQAGTLVAHYTQTDQVQAAITQGTLRSFVDAANVAQSVAQSGRPPRFDLETEQVEDESLEAIQFVTPGLLGWAIAMSASFGVASTLQGWRTSKLLRRLQLSPAPTGSVVAARVVTSIGIALVQMLIFIGLGIAAFGLQLTGSWWMAVPLLVCGTLSFIAIGMLAGALAKTEEGAVNMANFIVLPMAFLSGSFFPLDAAPGWLQAISQALPLRHLNDAMLDVMVRGQGPATALVPMAILLGFALVVGVVAARLFQWDAD